MKKMTIILFSLLVTSISVAQLPKVGDFALIDYRGKFHQMSRKSNHEAIVLVTQVNSCANTSELVSRVNSLHDANGDDFYFALLNTDLADSRASVGETTIQLNADIPVLMDTAQSIADSLSATQAGEVFVLRTEDNQVLWQGMIDDTNLDLALDAIQSGGTLPAISKVRSADCLIAFDFHERNQLDGISFAFDIVPILERRCISCHNEGGIAPWAMSGYEMVKGWSPMIRETILTKRMPPGQIDMEIGHFKRVNELNAEEELILLQWIAMGSPLDADGTDPLAQLQVANPEWPLGEPDHILTIEPQTIPANGLLDYYYAMVVNDLGEDKWIRRIDFNPGNREVVHHAAAYLTDKGSTNPLGRSYLLGWTPGRVPVDFPDSSGQRLPADQDVILELHYTTVGYETTDQTQIGLYFWDEPPENVMRDEPIVNPRIQIPPYDGNYETQASRVFNDDILLYALTPHMHYRGKEMKYTVVYPDGTSEELLSVPNYQFAWQYVYDLSEPMLLPAGSRIVVSGTFDNSEQNPFNPDPSREVRFGQQTYDEMFIGMTMYRIIGESPSDFKN
jgi:hypothetical protein